MMEAIQRWPIGAILRSRSEWGLFRNCPVGAIPCGRPTGIFWNRLVGTIPCGRPVALFLYRLRRLPSPPEVKFTHNFTETNVVLAPLVRLSPDPSPPERGDISARLRSCVDIFGIGNFSACYSINPLCAPSVPPSALPSVRTQLPCSSFPTTVTVILLLVKTTILRLVGKLHPEGRGRGDGNVKWPAV